MLDYAYYQIWRPGPDPHYVTDRRFSAHLTEACDGYAACENRLRKILTRGEKQNLLQTDSCISGSYDALKKTTFEIQEAVRQVLKANGKKTIRCVPPDHIFMLEDPMALSRYSCSITLNGHELIFVPFRDLPQGKLGEWYLEHASAFSLSFRRKEPPLHQLLTATAALRCLLYAQFGPLSEAALSPAKCKGEGTGYYTYRSLFSLQPPEWKETEQYGFLYSPGRSYSIKQYPF